MPTEHRNEVQLRLTGIDIQSFDVTSYSIEDGQPYSGVTVLGDKITVHAGRSGSDTVADWFKTMANTGIVVACDTFDRYPSKLNFAVYGTLTFISAGKTFVVKNMLLAQGSSARGRNNWWVGGPSMEGGSANPFIGAAVANATTQKGKLPGLAKVGFIAPPASVSHFDLAVLSS
jgi:1-phosphatidylinositol phosphodiesterase